MARTPSNMLPLNTLAPDFKLLDAISNDEKTLSELKGEKATVIMFLCNHCPYVKHVNSALVDLANKYQPEGVSFIAISSNDVENYPEDSPELMQKMAQELAYPFVYLYDKTQEVAKAYDAACTPDFYVFDHSLLLVYRGQLDDSRPQNQIPVNGKDIRAALDAILEGADINPVQKPSLGCNIKWKENQ